MNIYVRSLLSLATLVLVTLDGRSLQQTPLTWSVLAVIMLIYLLMIWVRQSWCTRTKYVLAVCLLMALTLILHLFNGGNSYVGSLLVPLVLLLAREQQHYRQFTAILAALTIAVIFALSFPSPLAFALLPGVITLYFCVRAINKYKEAHRLSQLHVQLLDEAHQELQQTHAALQEASVHSMRYAALAERTRLAQEMHDGLGHQLTSLIVQLQTLEMMLPGEPIRAANAVPAMLEVARKAMAEVRLAVSARSEDERGLGLVALQGLVSQCAAHAHLPLAFQQDDDLADWSVEVSVALYRVLQEALTNIMRHAEATSATIQVQERDQQVILTVADNGHYTANTELSPGFGLKGIMERCQPLGGSCMLSQNQPHGLKLQVMLPTTPLAQGDGALKPTPHNNVGAIPSIPFSERRERHG